MIDVVLLLGALNQNINTVRSNLGNQQKTLKKCSVTVVAINELFPSFKEKAHSSHSCNDMFAQKRVLSLALVRSQFCYLSIH